MSLDRRTLLRTLGAGTVGTAIAGCSSRGNGGSETTGTSTSGSTAEATGTKTGTTRTSTKTSRTTQTTQTTTEAQQKQTVTRESIMPGTPDETPVVTIDAEAEGKRVLLVGGVHGDEVSGWKTATAVTEWSIDAGTLVVIPRASRRAIEKRQRKHPVWGNTNRMFPSGEDPRSPLGKALWQTVVDADPDYVFDLHSSIGIYTQSVYYGQNIYRTPELEPQITQVINYLNDEIVPESKPTYDFVQNDIDVDYEMLVTKARDDLGIPSALFEVTEKGLSRKTQVAWTTAYVRKLFDVLGIKSMDG